ncbi:hypothetical protein BHM03_00027766 [Ensete ventricosum]|nr:hypothetical protein BHM03_00027766 [Ensete ventricosum]
MDTPTLSLLSSFPSLLLPFPAAANTVVATSLISSSSSVGHTRRCCFSLPSRAPSCCSTWLPLLPYTSLVASSHTLLCIALALGRDLLYHCHHCHYASVGDNDSNVAPTLTDVDRRCPSTAASLATSLIIVPSFPTSFIASSSTPPLLHYSCTINVVLVSSSLLVVITVTATVRHPSLFRMAILPLPVDPALPSSILALSDVPPLLLPSSSSLLTNHYFLTHSHYFPSHDTTAAFHSSRVAPSSIDGVPFPAVAISYAFTGDTTVALLHFSMSMLLPSSIERL